MEINNLIQVNQMIKKKKYEKIHIFIQKEDLTVKYMRISFLEFEREHIFFNQSFFWTVYDDLKVLFVFILSKNKMFCIRRLLMAFYLYK